MSNQHNYDHGNDHGQYFDEDAEWRYNAERSLKDKDEVGTILNQIQDALEGSRFNEAQPLFDKLPLDSMHPRAQMRYHFLAGWLQLSLGQMDVAYTELTHSLQLATQMKARIPLAYISYRLGIYHYRNNQFVEAEGYFIQTWSAFYDHEIDDPKLKAYVNHSLGNATLRLGRFENAVGHYHDAMEQASAFDSSKWVGSVCWGLGLAHYHQGDLGVAKVEFSEALRLQQQEPINSFLATLTGMYGMILIELNQPHAAERELNHAIYLGRQVGDNTILVTAQGNLAHAYLAQGRLSEALTMAQEALAQAYALGVTALDVAQTQQTLAKVHAQMGSYEQAAANLAEAEETMRKSGDSVKYMALLYDYGWMLKKAGEYHHAAQKLTLACYLRNPAWQYLEMEYAQPWL